MLMAHFQTPCQIDVQQVPWMEAAVYYPMPVWIRHYKLSEVMVAEVMQAILEIGIFLCKDLMVGLLKRKGLNVVNSTKGPVGLIKEQCDSGGSVLFCLF